MDFGLSTCLSCAKDGHGQAKKYGVLTYEHKTGGEVQLMTGRRALSSFKSMVRRQGRGGGFSSSSGNSANRYAEEER